MKKRSRETAAPEITPLIDVVFLLLIFFMVSTVFKKDELALLLSLPKTQEGETNSQTNKKNILIELSSSELAYNGKKITIDTIGAELGLIKDKMVPVDLRIDKEVKYDRIVKILDVLKRFELSNLSLITDK
jgi:biopolymer transport protein ExbD